MSKEKRSHFLSVVLCASFLVCGLLIGHYYPLIMRESDHQDMVVHTNLEFTIWDDAGVRTSYSGNVRTNIGSVHVQHFLGWANQTNAGCQYISLGNATPAATLTKLTTEATTGNLTRRTADSVVKWMNGTKYALNVTVLFIGSANYVSVQSCGLHWVVTSDSDNNMFACSYLTDGTYQQFGVGTRASLKWIITIG